MPKTKQFEPNKTVEECHLDEFGDDDVDVTGTSTGGLSLAKGDTGIWRYKYTKGGPGYLGTTDDLADIEDLHFYGSGTGAKVRTTLTLVFADGSSSIPLIWEQDWGPNNLRVSNEDNVLGNLNELCICGFEIQVEVLRSSINLKRIDFLWEVNGLKTCECPARKKPGILKSVGPEDIDTFLDKETDNSEKKFHADKKVKAILKEKHETTKKTSGRKAPAVRIAKARREKQAEGKKWALVIVGDLTGNTFVDQAMHNTAIEAEKDFTNRGYTTDRMDTLTRAMVERLLRSGQFTAICFIGHGGDIKAGDSANGTPGDRGGNDFLWPNAGEVMDSGDVQTWMGGRAMDVVILHACVQGSTNTAQRWQTAFSVSKANFYSWSGLCRYDRAFWWQQIWK
ncbi:MAG: hypothetical protein M0Q92_10485 [Methanoregula sp.]|jgi:hypothetical protein|nr:hypothetical protein [Methanoregula sp.]